MPLQISTPNSSSTKVARVLHYGDPTLDEEIVIPKYDYATITLEQINLMQEALEERRKKKYPGMSINKRKHFMILKTSF